MQGVCLRNACEVVKCLNEGQQSPESTPAGTCCRDCAQQTQKIQTVVPLQAGPIMSTAKHHELMPQHHFDAVVMVGVSQMPTALEAAPVCCRS